MPTKTEGSTQFKSASFGVKVTTRYASDGSKMERPLSVKHIDDIRKRRVKRKPY
jgi:hypothetical protein